ncbi:type II toxin-antitoxin system RelE/ParE family toxin [Prosthecobacter sp.]|uniref:type II toxin-antitoxin system RelE/ParE family toxin n=1 Tax=Prosthecobacter sp. TaxID=1965333 RepID=UPI0037846A04
MEQIEWFESDENHGGEDLAQAWLLKLHKALAGLGQMPGKHPPAPENGRWRPEFEVRQLLFRPWKSGIGWRVLFVIDEPKRQVTVLQIRHERRRWMFEVEE